MKEDFLKGFIFWKGIARHIQIGDFYDIKKTGMSHNNIFVQLPLLVTLNLDRTLIQLFMITYSLNKSADNILVRFDYARNPPIENSKNEMEAAYEVPWILYEDRMGRILSLSPTLRTRENLLLITDFQSFFLGKASIGEYV